MSRSRLAAPILVLSLLLLAFPAMAQEAATVEQLEARIATLEKRIASLEKSLAAQLRSLEQRIAAGRNAPNPLEGEASAAFAKINAQVAAGNADQAKVMMADFMKKYGTTNAAKKARRLNQELAVFGKEQPADWGIEKWFQGESDINLAGDSTKLLVFWELWCPHCKREVPKVQAMYNSLKDQGLEVVGLTKITKSSTEEQVTEFIAQQGVAYPIAKENGTASRYFGVSGIPAAAVVKGGKVVWRGHPGSLTEAMLKGWL